MQDGNETNKRKCRKKVFHFQWKQNAQRNEENKSFWNRFLNDANCFRDTLIPTMAQPSNINYIGIFIIIHVFLCGDAEPRLPYVHLFKPHRAARCWDCIASEASKIVFDIKKWKWCEWGGERSETILDLFWAAHFQVSFSVEVSFSSLIFKFQSEF